MAWTEWIWVSIVIWLSLTFFGWIKRDSPLKAMAGIIGIVFGILYMTSHFLTALILILVNFYLIYDAIESD